MEKSFLRNRRGEGVESLSNVPRPETQVTANRGQVIGREK